jgi:hypothetical protein
MSLPSEFGAMAAMLLFGSIFAALSLVLGVAAILLSPWIWIPTGVCVSITSLLIFRLCQNGYL